MKSSFRILSYVLLTVITIVAGLTMYWLNHRTEASELSKQLISVLPEAIAPKPRVATITVAPQVWPIYSIYSGTLQPWETYKVGFEIAGRIECLSEQPGQPQLDEGDSVSAGQILARLDDRVLKAMKDEAASNLELATSDLNRARRVREGGSNAITDNEFQKRLTNKAKAQAQFEIAQKNLENTIIRSPIDAIISKRYFNAGESINPQQIVFELIQTNPMKLVVDVPESRISELQRRMTELQGEHRTGHRTGQSPDSGKKQKSIPAVVQLQGTDQFGDPWPALDGTVFQISQVTQQQTGLFEVEIEIDDPNHLLRSGMVATAWLEEGSVYGYQLPENTLVARHANAKIMIVEEEPYEVKALYWPVGKLKQYRVHQLTIKRFVEQRAMPQSLQTSRSLARLTPVVLIPAENDKVLRVIVRGQHRLANGQLVRLVDKEEKSTSVTEQTKEIPQPLPTAGS